MPPDSPPPAPPVAAPAPAPASKLGVLGSPAAPGALAMYVDLLDLLVLGHPPARPEAQMNRFFFYVGLAGFGGWLSMAAYLILYLKYIRKIPGEWEEYWPQAIPIATVCAVSSLVAFCVAFWPVWSWLTIPCVFVLFLGVLNLAHFVPL